MNASLKTVYINLQFKKASKHYNFTHIAILNWVIKSMIYFVLSFYETVLQYFLLLFDE